MQFLGYSQIVCVFIYEDISLNLSHERCHITVFLLPASMLLFFIITYNVSHTLIVNFLEFVCAVEGFCDHWSFRSGGEKKNHNQKQMVVYILRPFW